MKTRMIISMGIVAILTMSNTGCENTPQQTEQQKVQQNMTVLQTQDPIPNLSNSLERKNIIKRLRTFEDANKVSYIYLISFGKVMAFYVVKGKVTSGGKRLTSTQQQVEEQSSVQDNVMEAPELDGTYGSSSPYIFFWTTDGTYIQWSDAYMLCDKPLKLSTQPELTMSLDNK